MHVHISHSIENSSRTATERSTITRGPVLWDHNRFFAISLQLTTSLLDNFRQYVGATKLQESCSCSLDLGLGLGLGLGHLVLVLDL